MTPEEINKILKEYQKNRKDYTDKQLDGWALSSAIQKGRAKPDYQKQKISKTLKGRPIPENVKKKMSKSRMGHGWSQKTLKKMSESARKRMKPISQFDLHGNWIKDFNGLAEMHDEIGLDKRGVQIVCNNWRDNTEKGSKQCGGFIWKYKE